MTESSVIFHCPSKLLTRLAKWVVVVMLVLATGSHWALLQSVAWVSMAVEFSESVPLPAAVQKALGGQYPCNLCKVVQEARKGDQPQHMQKLETKIDFFCEPEDAFIPSVKRFELPQLPPDQLAGRSDAPLLPPPKLG